MLQIPIIDLSTITNSSTITTADQQQLKEYEIVGGKIREALSSVGFMYLINHAIPEQVIKNGFQQSREFFNLPNEVKLKYKKNLAESRHGWVQPGQELLHPNSVYELRECFDIIGSKKFFPTAEVPTFQSAMREFENAGKGLVRKLLKLMGIALGLEDCEYFLKCSTHLDNSAVPNQSDFSAIYYPPLSADLRIPVGTVRCSEHTDYEILTLLFQDNIGGLEIKSAVNGDWIPATPIPGSVLVNTGDLLEFWTNGYFPATTHRVVIPPGETEKRTARHSFAYFFAPDDATVVSPLTSQLMTVTKSEETGKQVIAGEHILERVRVAYQY